MSSKIGSVITKSNRRCIFFPSILNTISVLQRGKSNTIQIPYTIIFPGSEIPDWFRHHSRGHEINIKVPSNWYDNSNFLGFALSAIIAQKRGSKAWFMYCDLDTNDLSSTSHRILSFVDAWSYQLESTPIQSDHVWLAYVPSFFSFTSEKWNHIKFSFSSSDDYCNVKSCGVCPVYVKGTSDEANNLVLQDVTVGAFSSDNQEGLDTLNTDPYAQDQEGMQLNDSVLTTTELDTLNTDPYAQDQEGMQLNDSVLTATFNKRRRRDTDLL